MRRVIAIVACGFTATACSASMPSINFLSAWHPAEVLRFESKPPGAEVRTSLGQTCRTPCELDVPDTPQMSATFALKGYQPQTISVRLEASGGLSRGWLAPHNVHAELQPAPVAQSLKKRIKKKVSTVAFPKNLPARVPSEVAPTSSPAPAAPAVPEQNYPWPEPRGASSPAPVTPAPAPKYPWPEAPAVKQQP
jgi:hypothetical protein